MNTLFEDKNVLYNLKVAERCDRDVRPFTRTHHRDGAAYSPAAQALKKTAEKGMIFDAILTYLAQNPKSKCGDVSKNILDGQFTCQKISAYLNKLVVAGYVKKEELEPIAVKVVDYYRSGNEPVYMAIMTTPVVFSLA